MKYTSENLVIRAASAPGPSGLLNSVRPEQAGWKHLHADAVRLTKDETHAGKTEECESVIVILGGRASVTSTRGEWPSIGEREDVFSGMPWALYLPRRTDFVIRALSERLEFARCWVATDQDHAPRLVTPEDSKVEIRGGGHATRQINSILPPGFDCHRIVAVEVYTPGGNWSSYPGHKHDQHRAAADGSLTEADLEEIYLYKFRQPEGWAFQRIYTDDRSIDAAVVARDNDAVLVPEGYHPVSAAEGYDCYYLNFLAGSAQSLACVDDPAHAWVKGSWTDKDPRVPLVGPGASKR